jgi:hypothetical protein
MDPIPAPARAAFLGAKGGARQYASRKPKEERTHNGVVFDSMDEMRAFQAAETIVPACWLHRGEKFDLLAKKEIYTRGERKLLQAMTWSCDIMVGPPRARIDAPVDDRHLVIDVKGSIKMVTPAFKVRLKLFEWRYIHVALLAEINTKKKMEAFQYRLLQHVNYLKSLPTS